MRSAVRAIDSCIFNFLNYVIDRKNVDDHDEIYENWKQYVFEADE